MARMLSRLKVLGRKKNLTYKSVTGKKNYKNERD